MFPIKKCYMGPPRIMVDLADFLTRKFKKRIHSPKWTIFTGNRWALSSVTETHNLICHKGKNVKCFLAFIFLAKNISIRITKH